MSGSYVWDPSASRVTRMAESSEARLANLLGAAATGLTDQICGVTAAAGLDVRAATALVALLDFTPFGSVQRLSQIVDLTHAGAVRLVDRLVQGGLVERTAGADARSVRIGLTVSGRRTARRIRKGRQLVMTEATDGLTEGQREELTNACERLVTNLTRQRLAERATGATPPGGALCRLCDFEACGRASGQCPAAATAADGLGRNSPLDRAARRPGPTTGQRRATVNQAAGRRHAAG